MLPQVERVVAERLGQSRSLLVKWEGLPYCEASWESAEDVMAAQGGPEARDDFLIRQQRLQVCICVGGPSFVVKEGLVLG